MVLPTASAGPRRIHTWGDRHGRRLGTLCRWSIAEEEAVTGFDYEECSQCGGSHGVEEHDLSPEDVGIPHTAFGTLYHGTPYRLEGGVIDPAHFSSHAMPGAHGTFATTSRSTAEEYARPNRWTESNARGRVIEPTVHEVVPHPEEHGPYDYDIDPNSGSGGFQDAPTVRDAAELASYGDEGGSGVNLMFGGRLLSKRQFRVGD